MCVRVRERQIICVCERETDILCVCVCVCVCVRARRGVSQLKLLSSTPSPMGANGLRAYNFKLITDII